MISTTFFFFLINIKSMVSESFGNGQIFLGIFMTFKWNDDPLTHVIISLSNFQTPLGSRHPALHCTHLFVINILCPFSYPKLMFWNVTIGYSFPLALNTLLKVINLLSDNNILTSKAFLSFYGLRWEVLGSQPPSLEVSEPRPGEGTLVVSSPVWTRTGTVVILYFKGWTGKPLTFSNQRGMLVWSCGTSVWLSSNHLSFLSLTWPMREMG